MQPVSSNPNPEQATVNPLLDQIIPIHKSLGWTSFDVVQKFRHLTGIKKVGHAGTLDPLAQGLLILATGKKTKSIAQIQEQTKEYRAQIVLGCTTPSFDSEFFPQSFKDTSYLDRAIIEKVITDNFVGEISQTPPLFSAVKVKGKRAYDLARNNQEVVLQPRKVTVYSFQIQDYAVISPHDLPDNSSFLRNPTPENCKPFSLPNTVQLVHISATISCSKGTYIRSLARDVGQKLGTSGYLTFLERTRIGDYTLSQALSLDSIEQNQRQPLARAELNF